MRNVLALTLAAILSAAGTSPVLAEGALRIGFIGELSGPQGALGIDQYDGFMLAVTRNGGKLGGVPVEVIKEDSQLKPELGAQIAQKLIEKDKVSIITGLTFSVVLNAIYRYVDEKKVFLILSNGAPSPFAGAQCSPYRFVTSWQNDQQAAVVGKYAQEKGFKRMVLMAPNFQGGRDYVSGFKREFKGEIVDEIYTGLDQQDFSAELTQVAAAKPDAVFVFYPGGLGISFVRQYDQLGLKKTIPLLSASTADGITLRAEGNAALGVITGSFWGPDFDNAASKEFVGAFEAKYNRIPSQYAAQSYDAALLLDSAIAKTNGVAVDTPAFRAALKAADFKSVRGAFKFNNNNFPIQDMYVFDAVKDDKGRMTLHTLGAPLKQNEDAYHSLCPLK